MTLRPLYLNGTQADIQVRLDGPSICVQFEQQAERRYPLRFLERLVVMGTVDMKINVLLACVVEGIPISFLDGRGKPVAFMHGMTEKILPLNLLLSHFIALVDWQDKYVLWKKSSINQYQIFFMEEQPYVAWVGQFCCDVFNGLLFNLINMELANVGLADNMKTFRGCGLPLDVDMVVILSPFVIKQLSSQQLLRQQPVHESMIIDCFENNLTEIKDQVNCLLQRFIHFLLSHAQ